MIVDEELIEFAYDADIAGLRFQLSADPRGLELCVFGYSHKLPMLLEKVVANVAAPALEEAVFLRLKDKFGKSLRNFAFAQPYQHAIFNSASSLELPKWSHADRIAALDSLTVADLRAFAVGQLLGRLKVECMVHGNAATAEAVEIGRAVVSGLGLTQLLFEARPASAARVVELPAGKVVVHQSRVPNPDDNNSAIEVVLQVGPDGVHSGDGTTTATGGGGGGGGLVKEKGGGGAEEGEGGGAEEGQVSGGRDYSIPACLAMVAHLGREPCFDDLRTKQQLGYMVFGPLLLLSGDESVLSLRVIVQGDVKDPVYVDGRIEAFLQWFRGTYLEGLSEEDYQVNVSAVAEKLLEKDKNLNEQTDRFFSQLANGSYDFDKKKNQA